MKITRLFILLLSLATTTAWAQQDAIYTQYMFNMMLVNPAYTGSRDIASVSALFRKQWINIPGAPETMTLAADMPLRNEAMGVGAVFFNDRIGVINNTGAYMNYSYRVRLTNNSLLSMGLSAGITNFQADFAKVVLDESGNNGDNAFSQNISRILPNLGAGLFFNTDKYYIGFSMPRILNNQLHPDPLFSARQYRHLFLTAGYVFDIDHNLALKPSTLIKQVYGAPIQVDLNANLWLYERYSLGISYRSLAAVVFLAEIQLIDQLRFGYAYDYSHTRIRRYSHGTHELLLRYEFGYDKGKMLTPRYF